MAKTTIQWTTTPLPDGTLHHGWTFNSHWGCVEQSAECDNCYARQLSRQWGFDIWGKDKPRRLFGDKHFQQLYSYNAEAKKVGANLKVFCNSMSDLFENHPDVKEAREKLFSIIDDTQNLNYLLLTKLPGWINRMKPDRFQPNVWYGTTVGIEDSKWRIKRLKKVIAAVRFLSIEPLLGPLPNLDLQGIDWVIIGGESGHKCREMKIEWVEDIINQCEKANVPVFVKQLGTKLSKELKLKHYMGGDMDEWPDSLSHFKIRQFPKGLDNPKQD